VQIDNNIIKIQETLVNEEGKGKWWGSAPGELQTGAFGDEVRVSLDHDARMNPLFNLLG
jgi:hypothetical protein